MSGQVAVGLVAVGLVAVVSSKLRGHYLLLSPKVGRTPSNYFHVSHGLINLSTANF